MSQSRDRWSRKGRDVIKLRRFLRGEADSATTGRGFLLVLRRGADIKPLGEFWRSDRFRGPWLAAECIRDNVELLIDRLSHIEEQPLASAYQAMPTAITSQPVLADFVAQTPCGIDC